MITSDTGPFVVVPQWLLLTPISDRALRLYAVLARYADNVTGEAHPSRMRLARELRCSESSLDRAVKDLVEYGALTVTPQWADSNERRPNLYQLLRVGAKRRSPVNTPVAPPVTPPPLTHDEGTRTIELDPEDLGGSSPVTTRDPVWDALADAFGEPSNKNAHGRRNKAVQLVKESLLHEHIDDPEAVAREIRARVRRWPRLFEGATLTDTALANNWDRLTGPKTVTLIERAPEPELDVLPLEENAERMAELVKQMGSIGREIT